MNKLYDMVLENQKIRLNILEFLYHRYTYEHTTYTESNIISDNLNLNHNTIKSCVIFLSEKGLLKLSMISSEGSFSVTLYTKGIDYIEKMAYELKG